MVIILMMWEKFLNAKRVFICAVNAPIMMAHHKAARFAAVTEYKIHQVNARVRMIIIISPVPLASTAKIAILFACHVMVHLQMTV